eukprot:6600609-Prymnesium_polylepis.1
MFHPFIGDKDVKMYGVEAAGDGIDTDRHSATLTMGKPGVLHGTRTYLLQVKAPQRRRARANPSASGTHVPHASGTHAPPSYAVSYTHLTLPTICSV